MTNMKSLLPTLKQQTNQTKSKVCKVHWESIIVREKWDDIKKHLYLIKETQQIVIYKNLRKFSEN